MSSLGTRHPSDEQLLHYADGELGARTSEEIRAHLKACWQCRNELDEIEQTISECVRYRQTVDTCLPSPPEPWFDIYPRLARMDELQVRDRLLRRVIAPLAGIWRHPLRWAPAAAAMVLIGLVVQQLRHASAVQAAELLREAVAAAQTRPHASRRIRIRTRTQHVTRIVGSETRASKSVRSDAIAGLQSLFEDAHYSWEDPLSAKSFSDWRDQLTDKHDEVTVEPNQYLVRTTTVSGELVAATLKLSPIDLHAIESTLQFRNREWVEISELPDLPELPLGASAGAEETGTAPRAHRSISPLVPAAPATPGDELAVLAGLHRIGADLGDPIEVSRSGEEILVTGAGIDLDRQQQIRQQLRALPRVVVRFSADIHNNLASLDALRPSRISVSPGTGPLQTQMEQQLGGHLAFEQFTDQVFDTTDRFMTRVHALRRLAQFFPPDVEAQMTLEQRQLLEQIRREHADALVESVSAAERLIDSALAISSVNVSPPSTASPWQDEAEHLFTDGRRVETLLVDLLAPPANQVQPPDLPDRAVASLAQLRMRAQNDRSLAAAQ